MGRWLSAFQSAIPVAVGTVKRSATVLLLWAKLFIPFLGIKSVVFDNPLLHPGFRIFLPYLARNQHAKDFILPVNAAQPCTTANPNTTHRGGTAEWAARCVRATKRNSSAVDRWRVVPSI
jgi:hypothetical protein